MSIYKFKSVSRNIYFNNKRKKYNLNSAENIPYIWYLTDTKKTKELSNTINILSKNNGVVIRHYIVKDKYKNIKKTIKNIRKKVPKFIISGVNYPLAYSYGNHIPKWLQIKPNKNKLISVSVHGYKDIRKCIHLKASIAFVSPVFKSSSHKNNTYLGVVKLGLLSRKLKIPVIGLGGINENNINLLRSLPIHGCAGIDVFEKHTKF